jgi:hypothetical protein
MMKKPDFVKTKSHVIEPRLPSRLRLGLLLTSGNGISEVKQ